MRLDLTRIPVANLAMRGGPKGLLRAPERADWRTTVGAEEDEPLRLFANGRMVMAVVQLEGQRAQQGLVVLRQRQPQLH